VHASHKSAQILVYAQSLLTNTAHGGHDPPAGVVVEPHSLGDVARGEERRVCLDVWCNDTKDEVFSRTKSKDTEKNVLRSNMDYRHQ
jgi:hypothetical protein